MAGTEPVVGQKRARSARYTRYKAEQIEVLEKVYAECSNPNNSQREKILREQPILKGVHSKQLKVWFQNRRNREKNKKGQDDLLAENKKLAAANKLLTEQLKHSRHSAITAPIAPPPTDACLVAGVSSPQLCIRMADNNNLILLAEETKSEFLSKVIGTAIKWNHLMALKLPSLNSIAHVHVPETCIGVAALASATISFEPNEAIEILKDRPRWSRDCRKMDVRVVCPMDNGGVIELIYTQYYALTTIPYAQDFWTLRYTSVLDDGSSVVCEKSMPASDAFPSSPAALDFVRGRMLASGFVVQPCEGGSTIHLLNHFDLEESIIPERIQPLYRSSELMTKKMIVTALQYIDHVASDKTFKTPHSYIREPPFLRNNSKRITRSFNDAISGFIEDGWKNIDTVGDVVVSINQPKNLEGQADYSSVICIKTSLILQNVLPSRLLKLLKERRTSWMNFVFTDHAAAYSKAAAVFPGVNTHTLAENVGPIGKSFGDEVMDINRFVRLERRYRNTKEEYLYHYQIFNGFEDAALEPYSELLLAPIDRSLTEDSPILASGFRAYLLRPEIRPMPPANMVANEGYNIANVGAAGNYLSTLFVMAFQFPSESYYHMEDVASMVLSYFQHILSAVREISLDARPPPALLNRPIFPAEAYPAAGVMNAPAPGPGQAPGPSSGPAPGPATGAGPSQASSSSFAFSLTNMIFQSYRLNLGVQMPGFNPQSTPSAFELIQYHPYAILCVSYTAIPVCLYANHAAFNMLETNMNSNTLSLTVDRLLNNSHLLSVQAILPTIEQQGYIFLPRGVLISDMNRYVGYEQAVVWRVQGLDGATEALSYAFVNWAFF